MKKKIDPGVEPTFQISKFEISGLFKKFHHIVDFPKVAINSSAPEVVILTGGNGVGKTTILNIIKGLLSLDFSHLRVIPFKNVKLSFSDGTILEVSKEKPGAPLKVSYKGLEAILHPEHTGANSEKELPKVEKFRNKIQPLLKEINFELIDIHRSIFLRKEEGSDSRKHYQQPPSDIYIETKRHYPGKLNASVIKPSSLSNKVLKFVTEAQVNYRKFFGTDEPELFPRILKRLAETNPSQVEPSELLMRLSRLKERDDQMCRLGLEIERWDLTRLNELLQPNSSAIQNIYGLSVLETYVEMLESRNEMRELVANRLLRFEEVINSFLIDKKVLIDSSKGIKIVSDTGDELEELQLSSGEYHILYMLVTALVTYRTGTIIAIDEPELSLHISWQRKLISALCECSLGAAPLFILASHSPNIASEYQDKWAELKY